MNDLLAVDDHGDVVVHRHGRSEPSRIHRAAGSDSVVSVAWTADGRAVVVSESTGAAAGRLVVHDVATGERSVLEQGFVAFYLCSSPDGSRLAHLANGPLGLELGVSDLAGGTYRLVERGQPLYWSWRPDSGALALHVGDTVLLHDLDGGRQVLTTEAGRFLAPIWGWDGSVLYAAADDLVVRAPDGTLTTLIEGIAPLRFAPDPDHRRIAYADPDGEGQVGLAVLDVVAGRSETVLDEPTAGFFWSADGRRLAALVAGEDPGSVRWAVWDGDGTDRLVSFVPGGAFVREVLPFFEQYALSHSVWSADGQVLVAPGRRGSGPVELLVQAVGPSLGDPVDLAPGFGDPADLGPGGLSSLGRGRLAWWRPAP